MTVNGGSFYEMQGGFLSAGSVQVQSLGTFNQTGGVVAATGFNVASGATYTLSSNNPENIQGLLSDSATISGTFIQSGHSNYYNNNI